MVVVGLNGGLGNQMFQYAAGLRLATARGVDLKLDLTFFNSPQYGVTPRHFELRKLNISGLVAKRCDIIKSMGCDYSRRGLEKIFYRQGGGTLLREKQFSFDEDVLSAPGDAYLKGYWQSERYFHDISDLVRQEFSLPFPPTGKNLEIAKRIQSCESVSLHVRRGDYVDCGKTAACHGTCSLDYYHECINRLTCSVRNPTFFIFTDDPQWVRANLSLDYPSQVVDHNGQGHGEEDMRLMSFCRHNIIANSSFSWWGAWLNSNPGKQVFAPAKWFANFDADLSDLFPPSWIKI